ncbi:redoxin domain-containing protein [Massilia sp. G4R7]|uniref:Redoxin domain-containing protein n=1 Tax=Massilia phyllostachyos TaxID=2898585 RepID=A0ABS8Q9L5_9BURK|nr:redoxin domain-containing protein [Massilia phyllostachyos]
MDTALTTGPAPEFEVAAWLNTPGPLTLAALRGKVVALYAFQMLCPGCVSHALPQAKAMEALFGRHELAVLGLHSVFEHHAAMGPQALAAFVHEYRIGFPVAIDQPDPDGPVPRTMARYRLRGTPTLMLFDREGRLRHSLFGHQHDMLVGSLMGRLLA